MKFRFKPKNHIKFFYYRIVAAFSCLFELACPSQITDYKKIPIIINNFNRLDSLKKLLESLENRGYTNIFIIDNLSTYPPLLEYYNTCRYTVFRLEQNIGMTALWRSGIYKKFKNDFFVYTDSDIVPIDECPDDFLLFFLKTLKKYKLAQKVGFSLKIDDLPDCYAMKEDVIFWEKHFFERRRDEFLFWAPIDTTFALYRPRGKRKHANYNIEMYRTAFPYMARHIPWYIDSENPDEENLYYMQQTLIKTSWSKKGKEFLAGN
jgi:glycosyltransferase involved in cell wall biosynthesis